MKLFNEPTTVEEIVQALNEDSKYYNCKITGFEVHKDSYYENDVYVSWWNFRGGFSIGLIISCSNEEEQDAVYSKWWQAVEIAGGKTRKAFEKEQEAIAQRNREMRIASGEINNDWMKALRI